MGVQISKLIKNNESNKTAKDLMNKYFQNYDGGKYVTTEAIKSLGLKHGPTREEHENNLLELKNYPIEKRMEALQNLMLEHELDLVD